jgi:hypothetical protein
VPAPDGQPLDPGGSRFSRRRGLRLGTGAARRLRGGGRALGTARLLAERFGAELHVVVGGVSRDERWWYEDYLGRVEAGPATLEYLSDRQDIVAAILATARSLDPCRVCSPPTGGPGWRWWDRRSRTSPAAFVGPWSPSLLV